MTTTPRPNDFRNLPADARRHDTIVPEAGHDAYRDVEGFPSGTACTECGLVYEAGRWAWAGERRTLRAPAHAAPGDHHLCPACRRVRDNYPAGFVTLSGAFVSTHLAEVLDVIRVNAGLELIEHPQNRVMTLETRGDEVEVTTTDAHLARRIGEALRDTYKGGLDVDYLKESDQVRVVWRREAVPVREAHEAVAEPLVEVVVHDVILTPEVQSYLQSRIDRLPDSYERILSSRVVLRGETRHHQTGGPYSVHIHIDVPQRVVVVTRQKRDDLHAAIKEAFDAAQRQLHEHARKQRGDVSPTVKPSRGHISRVFPELGYGFIDTGEGDAYFHRNAVLEHRFDELEVGREVRFELEGGDKGLQASTVALV